MDKEKEAVEILKKIKKIFDKHNIEYWLDEGTLLGAVRDKKFIEWDHDIDFGVWTETIPKIVPLFNEIQDPDLEIYYFDWKNHIKILSKTTEVDINPYAKNGKIATRRWFERNKLGDLLDYTIIVLRLGKIRFRKTKASKSLTEALIALRKFLPQKLITKKSNFLLKVFNGIGCKFKDQEIPSHYFTNLSTMKFYGMTFKVPKEKEKYLEFRYGKDWRTPKRDYVYTSDDLSIVKK
jgi:phosphorylcholine metabolism protein LicD